MANNLKTPNLSIKPQTPGRKLNQLKDRAEWLGLYLAPKSVQRWSQVGVSREPIPQQGGNHEEASSPQRSLPFSPCLVTTKVQSKSNRLSIVHPPPLGWSTSNQSLFEAWLQVRDGWGCCPLVLDWARIRLFLRNCYENPPPCLHEVASKEKNTPESWLSPFKPVFVFPSPR